MRTYCTCVCACVCVRVRVWVRGGEQVGGWAVVWVCVGADLIVALMGVQ